MHKTIKYSFKNNIVDLTITNGNRFNSYYLLINNIICSCFNAEAFINNPDTYIINACKRYFIEKQFNLINNN